MPDPGHTTSRPRLTDALLELHRLALFAREPEIYSAAIEAAVALTCSEIGYFHLVNEDQRTIELGTWSAGTLSRCKAVYERHYPIDSAGVWADSARHRRACLHNDYQALTAKRGYPEGHVHLVRHLGVPVISGERVVLLVGVGNKPDNYDEADRAAVQAIADEAWQLIVRSRRNIGLEMAERQLQELQDLASLAVWQWDPEEQAFLCNEKLNRLFSSRLNCNHSGGLDRLLNFFEEADRDIVRELLRNPSAETSFDMELNATRDNGEKITLQFCGNAHPRSQGHGMLLRGFVQDITERRQIDRIRYQAHHDLLTGLANRAALIAELDGCLDRHRREPADNFAVLFLDLDHFKPVNDKYGHAMGDRVLRVVAGRVLRTVRKGDLVARIGGDEIVVLQQQVAHAAASQALAEKILAAVSEPYEIAGEEIRIGVSIGIALSRDGAGTAEALLDRADRAMYRAKQTGRGNFRLDS